MIRSLQNITLTIVAITFLSFTSTLAITTMKCSSPTDCLAAISLYKMSDKDFNVSQTTATRLEANAAYSFDEIVTAIQVVSTYSLLVGIIIMIGLELFELRYFKLFIAAKKRRHATVSHK